MEPEHLLRLAKAAALAAGNEQTCRALGDVAKTDADRARLNNKTVRWQAESSRLWDELTLAINSALPPTLYAILDPSPVIVAGGNGLEIRGSLGQRSVAIRLTYTQAVAVGTNLIACAATLTDRHGSQLGTVLPPIPPPQPHADNA